MQTVSLYSPVQSSVRFELPVEIDSTGFHDTSNLKYCRYPILKKLRKLDIDSVTKRNGYSLFVGRVSCTLEPLLDQFPPGSRKKKRSCRSTLPVYAYYSNDLCIYLPRAADHDEVMEHLSLNLQRKNTTGANGYVDSSATDLSLLVGNERGKFAGRANWHRSRDDYA